MLTLLVLWVGFLGAAAVTGASLVRVDETDEPFCYASVIGLLVLPAPLLVISLFAPLTWWQFAAVWLLIPAVLWAWRRPSLPRPGWWPLGVMLAANAWSSSGPVMLYDTGLYHYPLLQWLDEIGTVPNQALLHHRFGFSSAWIAAPAALDEGWLDGRTAAILNGLLMALAMYHFAIVLSRWLRGPARPRDGYFVAAYLLCFLFGGLTQRFEVSLSPNWPVALAAVLASAAPASVALLLAGGAAGIKLSALPLVALWAIPVLWRERKLGTCLIAAVLLLPPIAANLVATGCPLYPSAIACLDADARTYARPVQMETSNWARWERGEMTNASLLRMDWVGGWVVRHWNAHLMTLTIMSLLVAAWRRQWDYGAWCALGGLLYVFAAAPDFRFALGYLAALCGYALAGTSLNLGWRGISAFGLATLGALGLLANSWSHEQAYRRIFGLKEPTFSLDRTLRPNRIRHHQGQTRRERGIGFDYFTPAQSDQCWGVQQPCTPSFVPKLRLCHPEQGLRGGLCR
ncbi:MAG: hypothetical protein JNN08_25180 [Bryobacterales bacterium]|nr:hypothetical protein [Bryobacterales bacterium]